MKTFRISMIFYILFVVILAACKIAVPVSKMAGEPQPVATLVIIKYKPTPTPSTNSIIPKTTPRSPRQPVSDLCVSSPLNIRTQHNADAQKVDVLDTGTVVTPILAYGGWRYVKTSKLSGWVNSDYLENCDG